MEMNQLTVNIRPIGLLRLHLLPHHHPITDSQGSLRQIWAIHFIFYITCVSYLCTEIVLTS